MNNIKKAVEYAFSNDVNNMKDYIDDTLHTKLTNALEQYKQSIAKNIINTNESIEEQNSIDEVLSPEDDVKEWIDDFIKSDAPQFEGKPKKERIKMAIAAYYSAKNAKNESEEEPSAGLTAKQKSEVVKKAKAGKDIGKAGKGFEKVVKKAKEYGATDPKAVAAAAMWKNIKR